MPLRHKNKMCFYAFPPYWKFPVSPSNLKKFDGVPGSREGAHTLRVLFWHLFSHERKKCGSNVPLQLSRGGVTACNLRAQAIEKGNFIFRGSVSC